MFKPFLKTAATASAVLAATCLATPASAAQFLFDYNGEGEFGTDIVTGTLTVEDTQNAIGGSLITAVSGTINGTAIDGLLAPGVFGGNDNLLFLGGGNLLSGGGFSFAAGGTAQNIFGSGQINALAFRSIGTFSVQRVTDPPVGAIPEPGTWALMLLGFGFVGAAMRRQRVRARVSYT